MPRTSSQLGTRPSQSEINVAVNKAESFRESNPNLLQLTQTGKLDTVDPRVIEGERIRREVNLLAKRALAFGGRIPDFLIKITEFLEWWGLVTNQNGEFHTHYQPLAVSRFENPIRGKNPDIKIHGAIAVRSILVRREIADQGIDIDQHVGPIIDGVPINESGPIIINGALHILFSSVIENWNERGEWLIPGFSKQELEELAKTFDHQYPREGKVAEGMIRRLERLYEYLRLIQAKHFPVQGNKPYNHLSLITERRRQGRIWHGGLEFFSGTKAPIILGEVERGEGDVLIQIKKSQKLLLDVINGEVKSRGKGFNPNRLRGGRSGLRPAQHYL